MDRESEEHEDLTRSTKEQNSENGAESEEEIQDSDPHTMLMQKISELSRHQERGGSDDNNVGVPEIKLDELRRIYETNNNGHAATRIPEAHRSPSGGGLTNSTAATTFGPFSPHLANAAAAAVAAADHERMLQYHINYISNASSYAQQQYPSSAAALSVLPTSVLQQANAAAAAMSFSSSLPSSRIPSPQQHSQYQRGKQNSPPSLTGNRGSPSFHSPPPAHVNRSSSVSSRQSREESTSPVHQSNWNFEDQFKQLYDIDRDDVKRREFLDDLFRYMQDHENPVTRLPIMAKSVLDLYELYKLVVQRGGLVDVINKKLWQEVIKGLNLPSSITSAAFTLRTQYMKFLYPYECHKLNLSTRAELDAAIEGNKREGRRTSYYNDHLGQIRSPNNNGSSNNHQSNNAQMSPVSLVTNPTNQMRIPSGASGPFNGHQPGAPDSRLMEYMKLMTSKFANNVTVNGIGSAADSPDAANLNLETLALWNICALRPPPHTQPLSPNSIQAFQQQQQLQQQIQHHQQQLQQQQQQQQQQHIQQQQQPQQQKQPPSSRPQSRSSTNDGPLDFCKNRGKDERRGSGESRSGIKRPASSRINDELEEIGSEESDSDSYEENNTISVLPCNSSQGSRNEDTASSIMIKVKIQGIKYKGVLIPAKDKNL